MIIIARIGYARVSTKDQNTERQFVLLKDCQKIFQDKLSGGTTSRKGFKEMMEFIREGDIVVVVELDRLGRNNKELTDTMNEIQKIGATIEVLNLPSLKGIEDTNLRRLINNLIIEVYKYQAQNDLEKIRERQRQGIELAKNKGKYKGKPKLYDENSPRLQHGFTLFKQGLTDKEVEQRTGINQRTFRRYRTLYGIRREDNK